METLFYIGVIFVLGALTERLSPKMHIPKVVGYLLLGLIIGPEILSIVSDKFVKDSHVIMDLALSIIAVMAGSTLKLSKLRGHTREIVYITLAQSLGTFIVVTCGLILMGNYLNEETVLIALILGAIATATAPATPLAIVHELRLKNNFASTLLAVVAADDAVALIVFSIALTAGITIIGHETYNIYAVVQALWLIFFSLLLGTAAAFLNRWFEKLFAHHKGMETISTLGLIFIVYALSGYFKVEPLLSAMVMGIVITNISKDFDIVEEEIDDHLAQIIFMLFFIISAMHLKFDALFSLPLYITAYVLLRFLGKITGSYIGAVLSKSNRVTKKYMGLALIPQAGVAIGLALSLQNQNGFESIAPTILNIVIAATLVHEIIGPFMSEFALKKSM